MQVSRGQASRGRKTELAQMQARGKPEEGQR